MKQKLEAGDVVNGTAGNYTITKFVQQGGMGMVFFAEDKNHKEVVVKVPLLNKDTEQRCSIHNDVRDWCFVGGKLRLEGNILRQMNHVDSIVNFIDEARSNDSTEYFLVIEKIDGGSLEDLVLINRQQFPESKAIKVSLSLFNALNEIHSKFIYHRDIKPDNIMMKLNGSPVLLDFGAGKIGAKQLNVSDVGGHTTTILMTEGWSCHHHSIRKYSNKCDLLALGRVMFAMITGERPASQRTVNHVLDNCRNSEETSCKTSPKCLILSKVGKRLLESCASTQYAKLVEDLLEPDHEKIHSASTVIQRLKQIQTPVPKRVGQIHNKKKPPVAPYIEFNNGTKEFLSVQGAGTLIGKIHPTYQCQTSGKDIIRCHKKNEGNNVYIGWKCPANCGGVHTQCLNNPEHWIPRHHLSIFKDQNTGEFKLFNNRRWLKCHGNGPNDRNPNGEIYCRHTPKAAIRSPNGKWRTIMCNEGTVINDNDEIALQYRKPEDKIAWKFTFHTS